MCKVSLELLEDRTLPSFLAPVSYAVGSVPQAVAVGDFNGDAKPDIVVANTFGNSVSVLLGKGDGTFQAARTYATGLGPQSVAVGDFNNDGKLDIVTANYSDGTVSVLLGNGDGTFQPALTTAVGSPPGSPTSPVSVAVGDFNKDGKLDISVGTYLYVPRYPRAGYGRTAVSVLLGNGTGTFQATPWYSDVVYGSSPPSVAVGDFNNDGKLDLATVAGVGSTPTLFLGKGDGTFQAPAYSGPGGDYRSLAVGDFNGDGKLDLATPDFSGTTVAVFLGNGDGTLQTGQRYAAGTSPYAVAVGDFNGDGKPDLAVTNASGLGVLFGNGNGTFQAAVNFASPPSPGALAVGDFNGDGRPDVVVVNAATNSISVLLNAADWAAAPQASSLVVTGFPSTTTAGLAGALTVTAKNAGGTTATGYAGTVHFTSSDKQAELPANYTFTAADGGMHTFSATLKTAGSQSITATDTTTANLTGIEAGITVNPAAASNLGVSAPAGSTAGSAFSVTVTARDPYNNAATSYAGTVHFTSTDGVATLPGNYIFTAADAGVHVFTNGVILKTAGSQTLTATDTVTASITGSAAVTVNPATASTFLVAGFPSSTTAGVAGTFTVTAKTASGTTVTNYTGAVHFTSSDSLAGLPANYTFTTADAGMHTFSATLKTAGTQSLTATDIVTASITGTQAGIVVNPAAASQFILSAPSSVTAGVAFSITITVKDAYGNVATGYTGTVRFSSSDPLATLPPDYIFTAADKGVHTFSGMILRTLGSQKITAADTLFPSLTGSWLIDVLGGVDQPNGSN